MTTDIAPLSDKEYQSATQLLLANNPPRFKQAAKVLGVDESIVRYAWSQGWPELGYHPIESLQPRASTTKGSQSLSLLTAQDDDLFFDIKQDIDKSLEYFPPMPVHRETPEQTQRQIEAVLEVMKDEERATKINRKMGIALAAGGARLAKAMLSVIPKLEGHLHEYFGGADATLTPSNVRMLKDMVLILKEIPTVTKEIMKADRLRVGQPEEIIGVKVQEQREVVLREDEMMREIAEMRRQREQEKLDAKDSDKQNVERLIERGRFNAGTYTR